MDVARKPAHPTLAKAEPQNDTNRSDNQSEKKQIFADLIHAFLETAITIQTAGRAAAEP